MSDKVQNIKVDPKEGLKKTIAKSAGNDIIQIKLDEFKVSGASAILATRSYKQKGRGDKWTDVRDVSARQARYAGKEGLDYVRKHPHYILRKHKIRAYFIITDADYERLMKLTNNQALQLDLTAQKKIKK
ncbi:MAG: hypothetical protein AAFO96_03725 [Bacteroidota bacterium]